MKLTTNTISVKLRGDKKSRVRSIVPDHSHPGFFAPVYTLRTVSLPKPNCYPDIV